MFEQTFKNIDDVLWKEAGCGSELVGMAAMTDHIARSCIEGKAISNRAFPDTIPRGQGDHLGHRFLRVLSALQDPACVMLHTQSRRTRPAS